MFFGIGQQEMTLEEIGDKFVVDQYIEQAVVLSFYKRCVHRNVASGYLQRIGDFINRDFQFICQLFGRRATFIFLFELENALLDVLVNDDSPMADRSLVNESLAREIDRALSTLTDREKEIIQMFFGIGQQEMTLEEIGDKFGLTRERVHHKN